MTAMFELCGLNFILTRAPHRLMYQYLNKQSGTIDKHYLVVLKTAIQRVAAFYLFSKDESDENRIL